MIVGPTPRYEWCLRIEAGTVVGVKVGWVRWYCKGYGEMGVRWHCKVGGVGLGGKGRWVSSCTVKGGGVG